jgi:GAF domain-containing protein
MKTALSIDNAFVDSRFSAPNEKDYPSGIKAVSCLPLMKQNSLVGVLYLENCSLVSAFVQTRLVVIQAVLPQIAISIENARLVSKLRATSSELQQRNEELKLEDNRKDQFLAITTHELRTPLHGVIGATSLLMETSLLSLEQQEYVAVIQGSAKVCSTLQPSFLLPLLSSFLHTE